jgi:hypothetical protein
MVYIITGILIGLFIAFQIYTFMATAKTEQQAYKVISTQKDYEIRFYPAVTMATISSTAKTYKELGSSGFTKLAGYIFGENKEKKHIAMTSPVHMNINDSASTMSFVMPAQYHKDNLPQPDDSEIKIETTNDEYVAAIRFDGFAKGEKIKEQTALLENALKAANIHYYGSFRFLGYNPPYQLFGRKNEIIVAVNWNSK